MKSGINVKKNDLINLKIVDVTIDGAGVGRFENIAVFVPGGAVGDELIVKIIKVKSNYLIGKIEKIISPSCDRIAVDCEVYSRCGGCSFRHISYEAELKIKQKNVRDCLERIGGFRDLKIQNIYGASCLLGYRNKAQIPVGAGKNNEIISGFFGLHSHNVVACKKCLLHPKEFDAITETIKKWMAKYGITPYNEVLKSGVIRHIYLRCTKNCSEIMVCVVINKSRFPRKKEFVDIITSEFENVKSIVVNYNFEDTNVVLGKKFETLWGDDYIIDDLCTKSFKISPASFYQVNHDQTEMLYRLAKQTLNLEGKEFLVDFYCGIGAIGLTMSDAVKNVLGIEIIEDAVKNARENAVLGGINNTKFICCDSSGVRKTSVLNTSPDVVVLDPPRKGCGDEFIKDLLYFCPSKILYISCNPATLAKDLQKLCKKCYNIEQVIPVDLFPRTPHVECIVSLKKTPQ